MNKTRQLLPIVLSLLGMVLASVPQHPLVAQTVRGSLLDEDTDAPISGVSLSLLLGTRGNEVVTGALTDSAGLFIIPSGSEGRFRLRAQRIGYGTVTSPPFDLIERDTLAVELRMSTEAIPLAPLTVVSDRMPLLNTIRLVTGGYVGRKELYGREGMGSATFMEKTDWEHRSPTMIAEIRAIAEMLATGGFIDQITSLEIRQREGVENEIGFDTGAILGHLLSDATRAG